MLSKHCGLASTFHEPHPYHGPVKNVGSLTGLSALELAQYARSDNVLEASIGLAAINSLICVDEARCVNENALDVLAAIHLSPVLFEHGVDVLAGVKVVEPVKTIRSISQGAVFSHVEGVRLVTMAKETKNDRNS